MRASETEDSLVETTAARVGSGARKLAERCVGVRAGEVVAIAANPSTLPVAQAMYEAVRELGAEPAILVYPPRRSDGREPPRTVAAALLTCDVFFTPVEISITHTRALKAAREAGARGLVMSAFTPAMLAGGGIDADFDACAPLCRAFAARLAAGARFRLTAPGGTSLEGAIHGRRGNALCGLARARGEFSTIPTIEANVSPIEGSCTGVIVADASIPYLGIGVVDAPVRLEVAGGLVRAVDGGRAAAAFSRALADAGDPASYNVAELGIGLNPCARLCGLMLEDEGVWGMVHLGIGSSIQLGGTVVAPTHYDVLVRGATIEVDGEVVLRDGEPVIGAQ